MSNKVSVFLASSSELKTDREQFEIYINRKNKEWADQDVFLELIVWEDFLDAMSPTRLQDEYNKAIRGCDIFLLLAATKVGKYTEEEFETAFGQFKATQKPVIFTFFKDVDLAGASQAHIDSLQAFKNKLSKLGHFYTLYKNVEDLKFRFEKQLKKLVKKGYIVLGKDTAIILKNLAQKGNRNVLSIKSKQVRAEDILQEGDDNKFNIG